MYEVFWGANAMLDKLQAVYSRYEELCAKSEQPDFYNDPKKAASFLREQNDLAPIVEAYRDYLAAQKAKQNLSAYKAALCRMKIKYSFIGSFHS